MIPISRWRCTAAKAAMCSLPRKLEMSAKVLDLPTQKDMRGHKLIKKYSKPRRRSKKNPKRWWDNKQDLRDIYKYCITDCDAEYELDQALPDLSADEQKVWELDQLINDRGILIDIPTVKIIIQMIAEEMGNIRLAVRQLSRDTISEATQRQKVLDWVNEHGAGMLNLRAETIRDKLTEPNVPPKVREMLEYRQGGSKTSVAKYHTMITAVGDDNRARELLLYCGATPTARWAGRRVQVQNMPRTTVKDFNSDEAIELIKSGGLKAIRTKYGTSKVMDVLVSAIRGMLIASPGYELFCADFAAVEARLAFWAAEHEEGVQAFLDERKLYEEMASGIFGMDVDAVKKDSLERWVGKSVLLGAQYGIGPVKFLKTCHQNGMHMVTDEIAKKAVYTYRKVHWPIPEMWKKLETAIIQAIQNPGIKFIVTKVTIYTSGNFLCIKLPSGRRLRYHKPRLAQKQLAGGRMVPEIRYMAMEKFQWREVVGWGGVFFNHVVQGIARDLLANSMMKIEAAKYRVLIHAHDEVLAERKKGQGSLKEFLHLMSGDLPAWAEGAPITCEGWVGPRYRK